MPAADKILIFELVIHWKKVYHNVVMFEGGKRKNVSGQAMLEYIIVFVALLGLVTALAYCLYAVRQQSNRTLDLVASEYP